MKPYTVKKQWRAVGACEYDIFHRDTKAQLRNEDIVGHPEEVYAIIRKPQDAVIADAYTRADANRIAKALNESPG